MQKHAPSFGRIARHGRLRAVVLRPAAVPVARVRRPDPAQAEGLPLHRRRSREATQLAKEADVRISGVPVGKVKTIEPDKKTGRSRRRDPARPAVRAAARRTRGRSCARRRCWARPTSSSRRARKSAPKIPEGGTLPTSQISPTVELDEIFRSFDPSTREAFQIWMQAPGAGDQGPRPRPQRRARQPRRRSPRTRASLVDILHRQDAAVRQLISNTGVVFDALTERDDQLRSLIENSNTVFATTAARNRELQAGVRRAPDVRARVAADAQPARPVRGRRRTRWSRSCGRPRAS